MVQEDKNTFGRYLDVYRKEEDEEGAIVRR